MTTIHLESAGIYPQQRFNAAVKIWSEILQEAIWVVETDRDVASVSADGVTDAIYTAEEIDRLKGTDKTLVIAAHRVKTAFNKSNVVQCSNLVEKPLKMALVEKYYTVVISKAGFVLEAAENISLSKPEAYFNKLGDFIFTCKATDEMQAVKLAKESLDGMEC